MKTNTNSYSHAEYSSPACEIVVIGNNYTLLNGSPLFGDDNTPGQPIDEEDIITF